MAQTPDPLTPPRETLLAWARDERTAYERTLREFVEIPSISKDPTCAEHMREQAEAAAALLRSAGAEVELFATGGHPIVFGRLQVDPALPTVTVYNHLDVQPAGEAEWRTKPFKMVTEGDRYIARGSTDDKGPALAALWGARRARHDGTRVNVQFLWELEEEIGSPNFAAGLRRMAAAGVRTDSIVVSDTVWIARGKPAMPAGLRGLQTLTLHLETGETDQHSGVTGGAARSPVAELCEVAAACVDARTGHCKIDGFYDDVVPPTEAELRDFARSGFTVEGFKADHLFKSIRFSDPMDVMRRIWAKPTFEVHALVGGDTGPGVKTAIAPRAELKVSMRLVPNQRPARMVELVRDFVRKVNPDVVVHADHALDPFSAATTGPYADAVRAAVKFAFEKDAVFVREGGSIGAVPTMQELLGAPVYFIGLSLPEHGYHAANECFDWEQASGGMVAFARYFAEVARIER